ICAYSLCKRVHQQQTHTPSQQYPTFAQPSATQNSRAPTTKQGAHSYTPERPSDKKSLSSQPGHCSSTTSSPPPYLPSRHRLPRLSYSTTQWTTINRRGDSGRNTASDEPQYFWNRRVSQILVLPRPVQHSWSSHHPSHWLLVFLPTWPQYDSLRNLSDSSQLPLRHHHSHVLISRDRSHIPDRRRNQATR